MAHESPEGGVAGPELLALTLRVLAGLAVLIIAGTVLRWRPALTGVLAGCGLALALWLIAMTTGWVYARTNSFGCIMAWLFGWQVAAWIGLALVIMIGGVHPAGLAVGASILPAGIVLATLYWWLVQKMGTRR